MPILGTVASSRLTTITPTYFLSNNTTTSEGWYGVAMDSTRNIYACGQKDISGIYRNAIVKLGATGIETTYQTESITLSGTGQNTYFSDLVIDSGDNVIAVGATGGTSRAIISKYNSALSSASFRHAITNGTNTMVYNFVLVDSSNNYYAFGIESLSTGVTQRIIALKFNSSGTVQWAKGITVSGGSDYSINGGVINGSDIYLTGSVTIGGNGQQSMIKMTTSGGLTLFKTLLIDGGNATGYDICFANGSLYTTAFIASYYQVVKFDTDFVAQATPISISYGSTAGGTITADATGNIYVGGWAYPSNRYLGFVTKYNANLSAITYERSFQTDSGINFETIRANSNLIQDNASNSLIIGSRSWKTGATGYGIIRIPQDGSKTQSIAYSVGSMSNLNYTTGLSRLEATRATTNSTRTGSIADLTYSVESGFSYALATQTITNGRTTFV